MEISVLDKQTIQCVMTEAEIADYGMDKNTIWQNGARAEDFFRQIMKRAQQETGFEKNGGQIAVHAAFLSDESLEITFSVNEWMQTAQAERFARPGSYDGILQKGACRAGWFAISISERVFYAGGCPGIWGA